MRVLNQVNLRHRLRDTVDPFDVSIDEFMALYRLPQHLVFKPTDLLRPYVPRRTSSHTVPLRQRVSRNLFPF